MHTFLHTRHTWTMHTLEIPLSIQILALSEMPGQAGATRVIQVGVMVFGSETQASFRMLARADAPVFSLGLCGAHTLHQRGLHQSWDSPRWPHQ